MRLRWFTHGCSCLVGAVAGALFLFLVSNLSVRAIEMLAQVPSGQPAVTVMVQEDYLNSEAGRQINGQFATGVDGITLTNLHIDVNPSNRLDLRADFRIDVGFFSFGTNAGITNRISAQGGKIVINMEGQPQLANITVPIDALPFNLSDKITAAIDRVNNDVIAAQLNSTLDANLQGTSLYLDAITTDDSSLTLHLKQK
jgi:hypothetical protein